MSQLCVGACNPLHHRSTGRLASNAQRMLMLPATAFIGSRRTSKRDHIIRIEKSSRFGGRLRCLMLQHHGVVVVAAGVGMIKALTAKELRCVMAAEGEMLSPP
jgi:hypothetical protein